MNYDEFDKAVDTRELRRQYEKAAANAYEDVPDGTYLCHIDRMEIRKTKDGKKLMFSVQLGIKEGKQKKRKLFWNRVITGNKSTETWNDGVAIRGVVTWLNKLLAEGEEPVEFKNYSDFADQVMELYQDLADSVELEVEWTAKAFNPIEVREVFDI